MSRRTTAAVGIILACVYVIAAMVSGHLDPLDRRPILDGLAPPPPYEWVSPRPALASGNQPPQPKTFRLTPVEATYDLSSGSVAGVFATGNYQATLALADGAFPPAQGARGAVLTMSPLAPSSDLSIPDGYHIAGNIMHITASYLPTGKAITALHSDAQLTLAYPVVYGVDDTLITSSDGKRWTVVRSTDHLGQQLVIGNIDRLGFFAVGQKSVLRSPSSSAGASGGNSIPVVALAVLAGLVIVSSVIILVLRARSEDGKRSRPSRPPRREDPFDPWRE